MSTPEDDGIVWQEISPRWVRLKRIRMVIGWVTFTAIIAVALAFFVPWWAPTTVAVLGLVWTAWRVTRAEKLRRAWGYAERGDDLLVRHGIWWRSMTAVPYGRMQVVEVESGPIERALGLSTVKLVTAASSTDATVEGLEADAAARLRERLTSMGASRTAGL